MKLIVIAMLTLWNTGVQEPSISSTAVVYRRTDLTPPKNVYGYVLSEKHAFRETSAGCVYRYVEPEHSPIDLFIYPAEGLDSSHGISNTTKISQTEADKFQKVFAIGKQRGWYSSYQVAFNHPTYINFGKDTVFGYATAVATKRGTALFVEFNYVYVVRNMIVAIRSTVPAEKYKKSDIQDFAEHVLKSITSS